MLNLLFISDSPKAEYIRGILQPVLKVIIDVVTDFDHGLKDVFEKRPTTVCIQDQIGGVTGESVARHIQMLLGNSAPSFILLHTGNEKAKTIKGLYDHVVDLGQPNDVLAKDIVNTLKMLLGDQWDKIFIPPKTSDTSAQPAVTLPEESREDADRLVDDLLSDLETSGFSIADSQPPAESVSGPLSEPAPEAQQAAAAVDAEISSGVSETAMVRNNSDEVAELLLAVANKAVQEDILKSAPPPVETSQEVVFKTESAPPPLPLVAPPPLPKAEPPKPPASAASPKSRVPDQPEPPVKPELPVAAGFKIGEKTSPIDDDIPEDLLLAFEENYRSESLNMRRNIIAIALVCIVCAAGGWYFVKQRGKAPDVRKQQALLPATAAKAPVAAPAAPAPVQRPMTAAAVNSVAPAPQLPSFIPKDGIDAAFAAKKPGWERYVGKTAEFRIFGDPGAIKAIQVLAVDGGAIKDSLLKSILQEFVGGSEYQVKSRSTKAGMRVERASIQNKGDVVIYRKNKVIKAFVVSVN